MMMKVCVCVHELASLSISTDKCIDLIHVYNYYKLILFAFYRRRSHEGREKEERSR